MSSFTTIISAEELHDRLDEPVVIIDCRHVLADFSLGRKLYNEKHLPGAFFADIESDLAGPRTGSNGRHPLPDPQAFIAFLRSIGVDKHTQVVAYDAGCDMFAARLWFVCRWIGHEKVAVLDGGITAWEASGYPVTAEISVADHIGDVEATLCNNLVVDARYVADHLESDDMMLVDARAADRFAGQNETIDPVAGHIPGATNRPFKENFSSSGQFRHADDLRTDFEALGDPHRIVHQCGSGVSAAVNALSMEIAGLHGWRIYAGSWSEWIADRSRPIA